MHIVDFEPCFVLNTRPYRESSALVDCFCQHSGLITVVAKGMKRKKNPLAGLMVPFTPLLLLAKGRHDLLTLYQVENNGPAYHLNHKALFIGLYLNELCYRLCGHHIAHPELFDHYHQMLHYLATEGINEAKLRYFELELLFALGYGLPLTHEALTGQKINPQQWYHFSVEQGAVAYRGSQPHPPMVFQGDLLQKLANKTLASAEDLKAAKRLMRSILAFHLGEKPLVSRLLMH